MTAYAWIKRKARLLPAELKTDGAASKRVLREMARRSADDVSLCGRSGGRGNVSRVSGWSQRQLGLGLAGGLPDVVVSTLVE